MAAELRGASLKGNAGTGRGFLEYHAEYLVLHRRIDIAALLHHFQLDGTLNQAIQFIGRKVQQGEKVSCIHGSGPVSPGQRTL